MIKIVALKVYTDTNTHTQHIQTQLSTLKYMDATLFLCRPNEKKNRNDVMKILTLKLHILSHIDFMFFFMFYEMH